MNLRYVPLTSALCVLAVMLGTWLYAFVTPTGAPTWLLWLISAAVLIASLSGIIASTKLKWHGWGKITYIGSMLLILIGYGSFFLFTEPTTINIFGFLSIAFGVVIANLSALMLTLSARHQ